MDATEAIMRAVAEREAAGTARPQPTATNSIVRAREAMNHDYWSKERRAGRRKYVALRNGGLSGADARPMRF